jgi:hypothetical protein
MIKNIKYSNNSLFIQFTDGEFIMQECDKNTALQIFNMTQEGADKETVYAVLDPQFKTLVEEVEVVKQENQLLLELVENITSDERFYFNENKLYRQNIPIPIPKVLAQKIQDCITNKQVEELDKLDKFWSWCSIMRTSEVRESFYQYIQKNKLPITKEGWVVSFRRADFVGTNKELQEFVTQERTRLRNNKKSTSVNVYKTEEGEYTLKAVSWVEDDYEDEQVEVENELVGNLKELYESFGTMQDIMESISSGNNGKAKYQIGVETRLPDEEVDWNPANECSSGLHGHNGIYQDNGYGDTRFAFVVNPADIASAPYSDGSKFRSAAITPICILKDEDNLLNFEITEGMQEMITEVVSNNIARLEQLVNSGQFTLGGGEHTLLAELPNLDYSKLFSVIKEVVNPNIVKDRLIKV